MAKTSYITHKNKHELVPFMARCNKICTLYKYFSIDHMFVRQTICQSKTFFMK